METYTEQLAKLWEQMRTTIIEKVETIGTESEVISGTKTIKINSEEFYCTADLGQSGGILSEIGVDNIFDDDGYAYGYGVLSHEELAQLADYVINL
jgi:hypothetical protein